MYQPFCMEDECTNSRKGATRTEQHMAGSPQLHLPDQDPVHSTFRIRALAGLEVFCVSDLDLRNGTILRGGYLPVAVLSIVVAADATDDVNIARCIVHEWVASVWN
jgi:hypothetical protein